MPAAIGPVERHILHASAKLDGKPVRWIVGVFANEGLLRHFAALLKLAYTHGDAVSIKAMDKHAPVLKDGQTLTEVKFNKQAVQYNPTAPALEGEDSL